MSGPGRFRPDFRLSDYQPDPDGDIQEEMRFYLEMREAELREEGCSPEEARRRAREAFGDPAAIAAQVKRFSVPAGRRRQRRELLGVLRQDVRFALRALHRAPAFTAVAIVTLGLGIGANTAIFSLAEAALLRQPPVLGPERLVSLHTTCRRGDPRCGSSWPDYLDYRDRQGAVEDLAALATRTVSLGGTGEARLVQGELVSGNFFRLLGLAPARGRLLIPEDDGGGGDVAVAVISHPLWSAHFGSDPDVVGRSVRLNGTPFTVVGVAPRDFTGLQLGAPGEVWVPMHALGLLGSDPGRLESRGSRWIDHLVGRLAPGASVERARTEMASLSLTMAGEAPDARGPRGITVDEPGGYIVSGQEPARMGRFVLLLNGVVAITLLLACANLANLLLARATARREEMGVRRALGAGRARLWRQLMTESLVLSVAGGMVGIGVAAAMMWGLSGLALPFGFAIGDLGLRLDGGVLAFTLAISLAAGLLFGLAPALRGAATAPARALREARGGGGRGTARAQTGLVGLQVALSVVLLAGAGLFVQSLREGLSVDFGFPVENLALLAFDPSLAGYGPESAPALVRAFEERLAAMPGVSFVTAGVDVPVVGGTMGIFVAVDGYEPGPDEEMRTEVNFVEPGYFRTLGLPLVEGREFTAADAEGAARVAIVSRTMAERWWPGRSALGGVLWQGGRGAPEDAFRVVGVVEDTRWNGLDAEEFPFLSLPLRQSPGRYARPIIVAARTAGEPAALLGSARAVLHGLDPEVALAEATTLEREIRRLLGPQRLAAWLLGGFSALALVLAAVGLYGVVGYAVSRRMPELALRAALGAGTGSLRRRILLRHLWPLAAGLALGLLGAAALSRLAAAFLFGVEPRDPLTLGAVCLLLATVGLAAMLVPTRRLARIQPMQVLRTE
ncbi:MAG TPA: ABC transporter permease [Longimicrobiales bacterium]|nr:ABC transporter permease [Longimicrobiales bacterium]